MLNQDTHLQCDGTCLCCAVRRESELDPWVKARHQQRPLWQHWATVTDRTRDSYKPGELCHGAARQLYTHTHTPQTTRLQQVLSIKPTSQRLENIVICVTRAARPRGRQLCLWLPLLVCVGSVLQESPSYLRTITSPLRVLWYGTHTSTGWGKKTERKGKLEMIWFYRNRLAVH